MPFSRYELEVAPVGGGALDPSKAIGSRPVRAKLYEYVVVVNRAQVDI